MKNGNMAFEDLLQNFFVMYLKCKSQFLQFKLLDLYLHMHD